MSIQWLEALWWSNLRRRIASSVVLAMTFGFLTVGGVSAATVEISNPGGDIERAKDAQRASATFEQLRRATVDSSEAGPAGIPIPAADGESERPRQSVNGLRPDQSGEPLRLPAQAPLQRYQSPASSSSNTVPGAFQVPVPGDVRGHPFMNDDGATSAARDLVRQASSATSPARDLMQQAGAELGASMAASGVGTVLHFETAGSQVIATSGGRDLPATGANASQGGLADDGDISVPKSRQEQMLESVLLSELIDQVKPWVIGLVALFLSWQLMRGLVHGLRTLQDAEVRRKAARAARSSRRRSRRR